MRISLCVLVVHGFGGSLVRRSSPGSIVLPVAAASRAASASAPPAADSIAAKRRRNFALRGAQSRFRIDLEMPREIDRGEEEIAQLFFDCAEMRTSGGWAAVRPEVRQSPPAACRRVHRRPASRSRPWRRANRACLPPASPAWCEECRPAWTIVRTCGRFAFSARLICSQLRRTASAVGGLARRRRYADDGE